MEKTYTKVTQEKQSGYRVESSCETIHIDMSSNVISLTHDTSCYAGGGFCTYPRIMMTSEYKLDSLWKNFLKKI